jgi:hypothetical protein
MGDAESKIKLFQYPKGFMTEPGLIPELKGMAEMFRAGKRSEKNTKFFQSLLLESESWWKLPEHHSQFFFQW